MSPLSRLLTGQGLFARALRGSMLTLGSYAFAQALRLGSNLILTRLLFPEAFGLLALMNVVLVGLAMFSDVGVGPAISQSPRGDEPGFLDTAFTINVARGAILWGMTCLLAWPLSQLYGAPDLALLLPVAGLSLLAAGFNPTRIDTANRHLLLGRVTVLDLISQVIGIAAMIGFALLWPSVWALVAGFIVGAVAKPVIMGRYLPGRRNRLTWEPEAGRALIRFGKWIFLSTACGFVLSQGDKAILGAYLTLEALGIYNIGYFLASFPMLLGGAVVGRIMIPIYRDRHPSASTENATRLRKMRFLLTGGVVGLLALMTLAGQPIVEVLYDSRYHGASGILVAIALVQMPLAIGMTYDQAALAAGDSRRYFLVMALRAATQTVAFLVGVELAGLTGALIGLGLAAVCLHGVIVWLARRYGVWDMAHDAVFVAIICAVAVVSLTQNAEILGLLPR
ncbi:MAG: oligosaccharide flippase family protein [Paracoccaceae bacterium]